MSKNKLDEYDSTLSKIITELEKVLTKREREVLENLKAESKNENN